MASNNDEVYEKLLSANLTRTVDWLKFAETKNAALLTFSSAWIIAVCNMLFSAKNEIIEPYFTLCVVVSPFFVIAALLALISFLPRTKIENFLHQKERIGRAPNLLFYGDIASMGCNRFTKEIAGKYRPKDKASATQGYLDDLCQQISINSEITLRKNNLFKYGAYTVFLPFAATLLTGVCQLIKPLIVSIFIGH